MSNILIIGETVHGSIRALCPRGAEDTDELLSLEDSKITTSVQEIRNLRYKYGQVICGTL